MKALPIKPLYYLLLGLLIVCFSSISYGNDDLSTDEMIEKAKEYFYEQDYQQAMQWHLKAADKGDDRAMNSVGIMYEYGQGVKQDYKQAMQWYLKAADNHNSLAMYNLAFMYKNGDGIPKDISKAKEWFQKAADLGDSEAKEVLKQLQ